MVPSREKCEALWVENFAILKELLTEMEFVKITLLSVKTEILRYV